VNVFAILVDQDAVLRSKRLERGSMTLSRRMVVSHSIRGLVAIAGVQGVSAQPKRELKALVFDTFGTLVDWRGSIVAEGSAWGKAKGVQHRLGAVCRQVAGRLRARDE
jgi:hypothetical protein